MDPVTQGVISGLIANALTVLAMHLGFKPKKEEFLQQIPQESIANVAKNIVWKGPPTEETVRSFLTSPEVESIVRQIFSARISNARGLEEIRKEFLNLFSLYSGVEKRELEDSGKFLFDAVVTGCENALNTGILTAHSVQEAKASIRYRIILDEFDTIQKNLDFLAGKHKPDLKAILEFEESYRQQVSSRHGYITPPHFDAARKLPIDNVYVSPSFTPPRKKEGEEPTLLTMLEFLSVIYRSVLLGNPGGGKSTFALKLCHDIATCYSKRLFAGRKVTPILVVLRDYGAEKKDRRCSILQFIEAVANSKYQVQPPPKAFEYMLLNGRAVVVFDGLDELLDTSYRQEIGGDIESFCNLYPSVPVLVTSREVGYEQAPLDEKRFEVFRLAPFDENQVADYVKKWFSEDTDLTTEQQRQKVKAFLEESRVVPDLRSNPLILALMCNIYRGENYIPRNRPDVYEKCATMLFERWDKSRGIHIPLPFEAHVKPAMMYLANWIYSDEKLQGGVTEKDLTAKAAEYLCPQRFEHRDEAEKAAREFIEFCRGRAWVFTDTGTTREGEGLYQFTHRTFLEYFTATYLVRKNPTPDKLKQILFPKIAKREWDIVAQLAFQIQYKNIEGAGDDLLFGLLRQVDASKGQEKFNLLSFSARCLEFIVPSPRVTREIAETCIEQSLALDALSYKQKKFAEHRFPSEGLESESEMELLGSLLNTTAENRDTIADCVEKQLVQLVNSGEESKALLALEIGLNLTMPLHYRLWMRRPHDEIVNFWKGVSDHIFRECSDKIKALYPKHLRPCVDSFVRGEVSISNFIKWHGVEAIFSRCGYRMFPWTFSWSPAEWLMARVLGSPYNSELSKCLASHLDNLRETGRILLSSAPWIKIKEKQFERIGFPPGMLEKDQFSSRSLEPGEPLSLDRDALFGVFTLFATILELEVKIERIIQEVKNSRIPFFDFMRWVFIARFTQADMDKVKAEMDQCGFTKEQQDFIWKWVRKEIDLVQKVPPK